MEKTVFNPAQMRILHLMSFVKTEKEMRNLEEVISNYFAQKADEGIDRLCEEGKITPEVIESWGKEHLRKHI